MMVGRQEASDHGEACASIEMRDICLAAAGMPQIRASPLSWRGDISGAFADEADYAARLSRAASASRGRFRKLDVYWMR